ncbi:thiolase family protein [Pontibacter ruber]|uniref:Thiolase family protein n=1 Tax=Pontibacter ruber TaxID=1343895 RepID=A0ABW5CVY2_9BACT|nr:acetyl-CoA C-acyltransferase [Pontibacter ruber]
MNSAYIVDIVRTPVGKFGGTLSSVRPDDMAAFVLKALLARNPQLDPALIEDVVLGAANQAGEDNRNVARMALLLAGLPEEIGGVTVNRLCASGLQSIIDASRAIACGDGEVYLAGGVESMTRAPFVMAKAETPFARTAEIYDTTIGWRFTNPALSALHYPFTMGETAENVAEREGISRETQDELAHSSQLKYKAAAEAGKFKDEIVPVEIPQRKGDPIIFDTDEHPRLSSVEKLGTLAPAFKKGGTVTAGNASGINDGAAASIIVSEEVLKRYNLKPMARIAGVGVAGVDPAHMGLGPIPATHKALKRACISINDIGLAEINEAFAAQAVPCMQRLEINPAIVNVNGGSIAIGHPLGASGTRISATLLHEMKRRDNVRYGLATMCVGVGQGVAIIYEKM